VVLKLMLTRGVITENQYDQAVHEKISHRQTDFDSRADYVAEMVRQKVVEEYKEQAYTSGIRVYTTLLKADQDAAYEAVRKNVMAYDQRHGYRGPEAFIQLPSDSEERDDAIDEVLRKTSFQR
jgi:penicillin-binding protein 1A